MTVDGIELHTAGTPLEEAKVAMIMIHGRGATAGDILSLTDRIQYTRIRLSSATSTGLYLVSTLVSRAIGSERAIVICRAQ